MGSACGLPGGQPFGGLVEHVLVGAGVALQARALRDDRGGAGLGAAGGGERAQVLAERALEGVQLSGARGTVRVGEGLAGPPLGVRRRAVLGLGVLAQRQRGRDGVGRPGPLQPLALLLPLLAPLRQGVGAAPRLGVPAPQPVQLPGLLGPAPRCVVSALGNADRLHGDFPPLPGTDPSQRRPLQHGLGQPVVTRGERPTIPLRGDDWLWAIVPQGDGGTSQR